MLKIQFLLPMAFLWCSLSTAVASDSEIDRASLKGLTGVFVLVEELNPPEEQAGLKAADIQTDVEEKLRLAGIPLLSKAEGVSTPGMPTLYISVSVASSATSDLWPFNIDVDLEQNASLTRSSEIFVPTAITWHVGAIGGVAKSDVPSIRDRVRGQVDRFVRAYLAVNPKK
jgi:hypothetical protein